MVKRRFIGIVFLIAIIIAVATGCGGSGPPEVEDTPAIEKDELTVHFLDVGQGDSILIELPNDEVSLIDGGNRWDSDFLVDYIKAQNIGKIDYLIATHPHADHIGGLPEVIKNFDIGKVYMPRKAASTKIFESFATEMQNKGLKATEGKGGKDIINEDDLLFTMIAPNSDNYSDTNDYSIVAKLTYKNVSIVFTGDAEKVSETEIVGIGYNLSADVLKVGHHGSITSTSEEFLNRVNPKYAIISAGKDNDYGHPHKEIIERLEKKGISISRTDELGTIILTSNGIDINIDKDDNIIDDDFRESGEIYIGNKNTKVFHAGDCNSLPNKENQIIFNSIQEAKKAGYRPHNTCVKE
ncbi:MAG TPA: MBL fold metallo-hydrolase [Thermoanaerobacterales bacterium]|nr:MBL fold metallo-hydrolase [Thermoanaerobacterales bacterium]